MNLLKNRIVFVLFAVILIFGFALRYNNLSVWPRLGATFDEYAWTWQGMSLIKTGVPTSWSYHSQYKNKKLIKYQDANFFLVTPYLEHPPLFGLVAGSYAMLKGVPDFYHVDIRNIRGLALILGTLSIVLLFLLARELYGDHVGLLSALLYAAVPTIAVGSRLVQNENFFIPVWLASLYLITLYLKTKNRLLRNISILLAGILILAKIPWVAAPFSIFIILLYKKRFKDAALVAVFSVLVFLIYFAYGFYYDKDVFLSLWGLQLNRYDIAFSSLYALFLKPYLADRFYLDGWIYWGWIAFFITCAGNFKKHYILVSAILSYFLIFLTGIPDESGHGWYRYPFYPFLMISIALFIKEYFAKNWIYTFLFLAFVGTALFELTWKPTFGFSYLIFRIAIIGWGIVLIPQYLSGGLVNKLGKAVSYTWLVLFIIMNIWAIIIYNEM